MRDFKTMLRERLTAFEGPTILPEPWALPPRRSRIIDVVRSYEDIDLTTPIDPACAYQVPPGHWFYLQGIALASNVRYVGADESNFVVNPHLRMWQDDNARIICRRNRVEFPQPGTAHKIRDPSAFIDRRDLGWKSYLNDITEVANLSYAFPVQVNNVVYIPDAWDTITNPGTSPVFYFQTLRPRGTPVHGLMTLVPIGILLGPGELFEIALDLSNVDPPCTPAAASVGPELVTDGGLENWATPNDLTSWVETITPPGQIAQDNITVHGGIWSALFTPATPLAGQTILQQTTVAIGAFRNYTLTFWHNESVATSAFQYWIINASAQYLQADGTWAAGVNTFTAPNSAAAWAQETKAFLSSGAGNYTIGFEAIDANDDVAEMFLDDVSIKEQVPAVQCPVHFRARIRGWLYPQTFLDYTAQGVQGE